MRYEEVTKLTRYQENLIIPQTGPAEGMPRVPLAQVLSLSSVSVSVSVSVLSLSLCPLSLPLSPSLSLSLSFCECV